MLPRLAGTKHFTIINCTNSLFMVSLTYNSSLLTAFDTIYGRYRYDRMPMGASPSSDILQVMLDHILSPEDNPFMCNIPDDIVIVSYDCDGSDHDRNVQQVFKTADGEGMEFNLDKCMFCSEFISFFGMILSREGMFPDPKKTEALSKVPFPNTMKKMQSFLGMANYPGRFTPRLALLTAPLRKLIKKGNAYVPLPHHQVAFQSTIEDICKESMLRYYRPDLDLASDVMPLRLHWE